MNIEKYAKNLNENEKIGLQQFINFLYELFSKKVLEVVAFSNEKTISMKHVVAAAGVVFGENYSSLKLKNKSGSDNNLLKKYIEDHFCEKSFSIDKKAAEFFSSTLENAITYIVNNRRSLVTNFLFNHILNNNNIFFSYDDIFFQNILIYNIFTDILKEINKNVTLPEEESIFLQSIIESIMISLIGMANITSLHTGRVTLYNTDIIHAYRIKNNLLYNIVNVEIKTKLTNPGIRRLCRRAGVKRMQKESYLETANVFKSISYILLNKCVELVEKDNIITHDVLLSAIKLLDITFIKNFSKSQEPERNIKDKVKSIKRSKYYRSVDRTVKSGSKK